MNTTISHLLEMFVRVRDYGAARTGLFRSDSHAPDLFDTVQSVVAEMNIFITSQTSGLSSVQQATGTRAEASETLRDMLLAMSRTARVMAFETPGLENKFRMPRSASDHALLQAARAFAADAPPFKDEFLRHEMPNSFIEDLQPAIANLDHAMDGQNAGREAHISATASIEEMVERGLKAVRRLDVIIRNRFRNEPAQLAAWEHARHIERRARTPKRTKSGAGTNQGGEGKEV
jgi:hypothetical protein